MISDDDFKFLLMETYMCEKILEIGTGTGKSTCALAAGGSEVWTVDRNDIFEYYGIGSNVHRFKMESEQWWKELDQYNFDACFIDGTIGWGDAEEILIRLKPNNKVIVHDYIPGEKGYRNINIFTALVLPEYEFDIKNGGTHCAVMELNYEPV